MAKGVVHSGVQEKRFKSGANSHTHHHSLRSSITAHNFLLCAPIFLVSDLLKICFTRAVRLATEYQIQDFDVVSLKIEVIVDLIDRSLVREAVGELESMVCIAAWGLVWRSVMAEFMAHQITSSVRRDTRRVPRHCSVESPHL
jgi:hypothetical protein